jgi:predicted lipoprotein with Yx(FWY)xxD motif
MKLRSLLAATAAAALFSITGGFAADYLGGAVKSTDIGGKMVLTDANGMTLYTWDKDEKGVVSNCYDKCAENWPPLLVPADTAIDGEWTLMDRKDSDMKIVAYKGWPLYLWIKDTMPGDTTGDGVGGTWHTAIE